MSRRAAHDTPTLVDYTSDDVQIPHDFLLKPAYDSVPTTATRIDFKAAGFPRYENAYAVVLENALSLSECETLLRLAEESAKTKGWKPALVNVAAGREMLIADYRNSDRIIWDSHEMVARIWQRCRTACPELGKELATIEKNPELQGHLALQAGEKWTFSRLNERMRFLKYGPGQYFRRHCDSYFSTPGKDGTERSFYTMQVYLNPDVDSEGVPLRGGSTAFCQPNSWNVDEDDLEKVAGEHKLKVESKRGRILIFQHKNLLHEGEMVENGLKYSMRTELMYERVPMDKLGKGRKLQEASA